MVDDVSGDGWLTPLDALLVINYLNAHALAAGEGEAAPHPNPLPGVPGRGSDLLAAALATGVFVTNPQVPGINGATTMVLMAVPEPLGSSQPLPEETSSDLTLAVPAQVHRHLPLRSASNGAFGGDWDATSAELEDALGDIAGEVGSQWQ